MSMLKNILAKTNRSTVHLAKSNSRRSRCGEIVGERNRSRKVADVDCWECLYIELSNLTGRSGVLLREVSELDDRLLEMYDQHITEGRDDRVSFE